MKANQPDSTINLERFLLAQEDTYREVLLELEREEKKGHWMWFIFPQVLGLGKSEMSKKYAIRSIKEADAYSQHPILGARLNECASTLLTIKNSSAKRIMGSLDAIKLKSSMTLFAYANGKYSLPRKVLDMYFEGKMDTFTLEIIDQLNKESYANNNYDLQPEDLDDLPENPATLEELLDIYPERMKALGPLQKK